MTFIHDLIIIKRRKCLILGIGCEVYDYDGKGDEWCGDGVVDDEDDYYILISSSLALYKIEVGN